MFLANSLKAFGGSIGSLSQPLSLKSFSFENKIPIDNRENEVFYAGLATGCAVIIGLLVVSIDIYIYQLI